MAILTVLPMASRQWWIPGLGFALVCDSQSERPDLILIDNLDSNYLLFEKAAELKELGFGEKVLIPR